VAGAATLAAGNTDKALDVIERELGPVGTLTPAWARIDPDFKARRGNPRFDKLTKGQARAALVPGAA
jgi:hypothetical protein